MTEGATDPMETEAIQPTPVDTFPRQQARTRRFTLGEPRNIVVSPDGRRIVFVRSQGGADAVNCLWVLDNDTGDERLVADPTQLLAGRDADDLPPEELTRRERMREAAGGVTSFATDEDVTVCAFALGGRLFVAGLMSGQTRELDVAGPVFDPRPDPPAQRVAYVSGRLLCVGELDGSWRVLAGDDPDEHDTVSWGSADFIAAEEIGRQRGYWWSPDGSMLAVCRVDVAPVDVWNIADPADPAQAPVEQRYPAAGTGNAEVRLFVIAVDGTEPVEMRWDLVAFPYLVDVRWDRRGLLLTVQSRDQKMLAVLRADPTTGNTINVSSDHDEKWVEIVPGTPRWDADGRLVTCADRDGVRRLLLDGEPVTPVDRQVRAVVAVDEAGVVYLANPVSDATVQHVWHVHPDGTHQAMTDEPGVHNASAGGGTIVVRTATLGEPGTFTTTLGGTVIESHAATPLVLPHVQIIRTDDRQLATAVLLPSDRDAYRGQPLPVLLDPYGGPHAQRVLSAQASYLASQWFADQGFVVVVTDGRGTPGRGSDWERAVHGDLATAPLDDQIEGVEAAARWVEQSGYGVTCDLDRVAIRGWSFGGYLAALAVLRRPDVFHAAVAGAPVTDWRLYDTHYTERYLGHPDDDTGPYERSSLTTLADQLTRPLLLIHGLADDNVVAAHTLRLSSALLTAGKPHEVLPLVGITHMASQE
ncbi:MAG: prolyl oligopeptidase family serine peptidase, partial [Actinomycetota bacterium]|nr:prolyl oligopeptidase family serine peptidase [Actinomycetota bacterium]